jgi:hypothetical protein
MLQEQQEPADIVEAIREGVRQKKLSLVIYDLPALLPHLPRLLPDLWEYDTDEEEEEVRCSFYTVHYVATLESQAMRLSPGRQQGSRANMSKLCQSSTLTGNATV